MHRLKVSPAALLLPWMACFSCTASLSAQPAAVGLVKVTDRVWAWIPERDDESNGALFVGDAAALIVDPGRTPESMGRFLQAVEAVTDVPIRWAVITHWHPDHAWGALCGSRSFPLLAHEKTRRSLAENFSRFAAQESSPCSPRLPEQTVRDRFTVDLGSHVVQILHPGIAHTAGDLVVWSAQERALATGDLFLNHSAPFMEEASVQGWADALAGLERLEPRHVIAGHFAVGGLDDLARFRAYLQHILESVRAQISLGVAPSEIPGRIDFSSFADFQQYPQHSATFSANAARAATELSGRAARRGEMGRFEIRAVIQAGRNPHQIAFSPDGGTAYVAAAASDWIAEIDANTFEVRAQHPVPGTPLGVAVPAAGDRLLATRFASSSLDRYRLPSFEAVAEAEVGAGPSLFYGPLAESRYLVSIERGDELRLIDGDTLETVQKFAVGRRPFPPAATSDGRLAFVPGYDDGRVAVVDLWNGRLLDSVPVGDRLSGGTVLPGDVEYAVAVRGENRVAFLNAASHRVVGQLREGIGDSPFSVVATADGRFAFVNNTASHDISVVDLASRRVTARLPVGQIPIVMAVHPSGRTLWVSSEGSHEVTVIAIPEPSPPAEAAQPVQATILGMIHGQHRESSLWGLRQVEETIRRFRPEVVCAEIPPDRWGRIWEDFAERGVVEDARIRLFPEYTDVLLPLKVELGFQVEPCAAWTREMSDLRQERMRQFETDQRWADKLEEYRGRLKELEEQQASWPEKDDDPRYIHSDLYDQRTRRELELYDKYLNEWIGPGGWTSINQAHLKLIERAVARHPGKRMLILFGAGHKYWFREKLADRRGVSLLDPGPFLPDE